MSSIIGIDLGTSNSVVATTDADGDPRLLRDEEGEAIQPSVVAFHPGGQVVVGKAAKKRRVIDPANTIHSIKRIIGRPYQAREVIAAATRVSYSIQEGPNEQPVIATRGGTFAPTEISAFVLDHMRGLAQRALGHGVEHAVVTVPANFTDAQRAATATAGSIAGLQVPQVINEPTAAAIAYGHKRGLHEIIGVYDFGGGTFDITLLRLAGDVYEVLGTAGDSFLGGDDIDERIADRMVEECLRTHRVDLRDDALAMQRLRAVAEQVKIELSRKTRALVRVDEIAYGPGGAPLDLELMLTREELVSRCWDIIERTFPICDEVLALAGVPRNKIDDVILVGGTTRMPYVRERVAHYFHREPRTEVNPDESIALGAALAGEALIRAAAKSTVAGITAMAPATDEVAAVEAVIEGEGAPTETMDVPTDMVEAPTTLDPGPLPDPLPPPGPPVLVPGPPVDPAMLVPPIAGNVRTTLRGAPPFKPPQAAPPATGPEVEFRPVSPTGAPPIAPAPITQAPAPVPGMPVVHDVTARSLGIGTVGGFCEFLVARNSRVPCEFRRVFSTSRDQQPLVRIRVCEGESRKISENVLLGALILEGLPARPRGETQIEVTFQIDAGGILHVRALDQPTGREQRASIQLRGAQSPAEVRASRERVGRMTMKGFDVPPEPTG